jgi:hypothetical protein
MIMFWVTVLVTLPMLVTTGAVSKLQSQPPNAAPSCSLGPAPETPSFALAADSGPTSAWFPYRVGQPGECDPVAGNCRKGRPVQGGDLLEVFFTKGEWTCAYHQGGDGGGTVWVKGNRLRIILPNSNPPYEHWLGTWVSKIDPYNRIVIRSNLDHRTLSVSGRSRWLGNHGVVDFGHVNGTVESGLNPLRVVEGECEVTIRLVGNYLVTGDTIACSGNNVRFGGFWRKASPRPKR